MPVDKSWIDLPRFSPEFGSALDSFVRTCEPLVEPDGTIRCPCKKCDNRYFMNLSAMQRHIQRWGLSRMYVRWIYHGEPLIPTVVENDVPPTNDMDAFKKSSKANKQNRQKLTVQNRGGSSSYARTAFRQNLDRVQAYKVHHTDRDGNFRITEKEAIYNQLVQELSNQTVTQSGENILTPAEYIHIFETVLGVRHGHYREVGTKPCGGRGSHGSSSKGKGTPFHPPNTFTPEVIKGIFMDPNFHTYMEQLYGLARPTIPPHWTQLGSSGSGTVDLSHGGDGSSSSSDDDDNEADAPARDAVRIIS